MLVANKNRMAHLRLALAWNRIDIAIDLFPEDTLLRDYTPEEGTATKEQTKSGKDTNSVGATVWACGDTSVCNRDSFEARYCRCPVETKTVDLVR